MGDRTAASLTIRRIGERGGSRKVREGIAELLYDLGLAREFNDPGQNEPSADNLVGEPWVDYEFSVGTMSEVVDGLLEVTSAIWFRAQEDAYSPWMGDLWMHAPGLGLFHQACSDEGIPMFTGDEVRTILETDVDLVERRLGKPWFDEFDRLGTARGHPSGASRLLSLLSRGGAS